MSSESIPGRDELGREPEFKHPDTPTNPPDSCSSLIPPYCDLIPRLQHLFGSGILPSELEYVLLVLLVLSMSILTLPMELSVTFHPLSKTLCSFFSAVSFFASLWFDVLDYFNGHSSRIRKTHTHTVCHPCSKGHSKGLGQKGWISLEMLCRTGQYVMHMGLT